MQNRLLLQCYYVILLCITLLCLLAAVALVRPSTCLVTNQILVPFVTSPRLAFNIACKHYSQSKSKVKDARFSYFSLDVHVADKTLLGKSFCARLPVRWHSFSELLSARRSVQKDESVR